MSSTAPFRPHGLIKTPMQQQFYNKAHLANVFTGIADPKEHATVALMEVILYGNIFTEDYFAVTSEQPPNPDSSKRCDLVVNYLEEGSDKIRTFCFAECKRAKKSQPFSLKALEEQATDYCKAYVDYEDAPFVYAATMAGAHVRLWKYMQGDDSLTPFWGHNDEGDWQQYKDIGIDEDGRLVEDSFNNMKGWTPTRMLDRLSATIHPINLLFQTIQAATFDIRRQAPIRHKPQAVFPAAGMISRSHIPPRAQRQAPLNINGMALQALQLGSSLRHTKVQEVLLQAHRLGKTPMKSMYTEVQEVMLQAHRLGKIPMKWM